MGREYYKNGILKYEDKFKDGIYNEEQNIFKIVKYQYIYKSKDK